MTRIIIIDDQPSFRRHLRELLTRAGLVVVGEAGDIPEAKELLQKTQPDMAILDVILPGESGIDGAPQLKALAPKMRIILVSAQYNRTQTFQNLATEAGAEAYLPKDDLNIEIVKKWARKAS